MAKVLEMLQAAGWTEPQTGGFGFSEASGAMRLVSAGWKAVYDALVTRLVLRRQTTDEAVGILVRRFPAVVSLEFKGTAQPRASDLREKNPNPLERAWSGNPMRRVWVTSNNPVGLCRRWERWISGLPSHRATFPPWVLATHKTAKRRGW